MEKVSERPRNPINPPLNTHLSFHDMEKFMQQMSISVICVAPKVLCNVATRAY